MYQDKGLKILSFICVVLTLGLGGYWSWGIWMNPAKPEIPLPAFSSEPPSRDSGFHAASSNRLLEVADSESIARRDKNRQEVRSPAVDADATVTEEVLAAREHYLAANDLKKQEERLTEFLPGDGLNRMLRTYFLMSEVPEGKSSDSQTLREYWEKGLADASPQAIDRLSRFLNDVPLESPDRSKTITLLTWIYLKNPESHLSVETALADEVTRVGPTPHGLRALSVLMSLKGDPNFKADFERRLATQHSEKGWGRFLASEPGQ